MVVMHIKNVHIITSLMEKKAKKAKYLKKKKNETSNSNKGQVLFPLSP